MVIGNIFGKIFTFLLKFMFTQKGQQCFCHPTNTATCWLKFLDELTDSPHGPVENGVARYVAAEVEPPRLPPLDFLQLAQYQPLLRGHSLQMKILADVVNAVFVFEQI